jgi:hypothetical protein
VAVRPRDPRLAFEKRGKQFSPNLQSQFGEVFLTMVVKYFVPTTPMKRKDKFAKP